MKQVQKRWKGRKDSQPHSDAKGLPKPMHILASKMLKKKRKREEKDKQTESLFKEVPLMPRRSVMPKVVNFVPVWSFIGTFRCSGQISVPFRKRRD